MRAPLAVFMLWGLLASCGLGQDQRPRTEQREFTQPTPLLNSQGSLDAWGWARRAIMRYNREAIPKARQSRIKEWEHYTIMSPEFTVGVTIVQLGPLLVGSAELIDYKTRSEQSTMLMTPGTLARSALPADPYGNTRVSRGEDFVAFDFADKRRKVEFHFAKSATSPAMSGSFELLDDPAGDSVAIARPFAAEGHFFYENKIFGMPTTGSISVGVQTYKLPVGDAWTIFDWGRGIWPHESSWFWGQAAGKVGDRQVAINLGHGYGDDARGTCNAILIDGKLHKLDLVDCQFDTSDRLRPWKFTSNDNRLTLTFEPTYQQHSKQNLGLISAELFKIHGRYTGTLVLDDGTRLEVQNLLGFAEHMQQKW